MLTQNVKTECQRVMKSAFESPTFLVALCVPKRSPAILIEYLKCALSFQTRKSQIKADGQRVPASRSDDTSSAIAKPKIADVSLQTTFASFYAKLFSHNRHFILSKKQRIFSFFEDKARDKANNRKADDQREKKSERVVQNFLGLVWLRRHEDAR